MSRSFSLGNHRFLLAVVASLLLGLSWAAASASATVQTNCAELQSMINTASSHANHGEGEVVVLTGMCDATSLKVKTGVTIPAGSNITIEGAPGTTSGFDGAGVENPLLHSATFEAVGTVAIRNLTFEHANVTAGSGSALQLEASDLTLAGDTFIENTTHGFGAGAVDVFVIGQGSKPVCPSSASPPGVTVTDSVFRDNKVIGTNQGNGGALIIAQVCEYPESILEGNLFEANTIELSGSGEALGGAFTFEPGGEKPTPLIQRGNVFDSNHIVSTSTTSDFGGGGEWTEGASLTSIGDRFSRNTIPGSGSGHWSWGGGLGILNSSCEPTAATKSTLEDAVVAGNSIGAGGGDLGGGGIYVGCSPVPAHPNSLTLLNSTVTQNSTPAGGVPGIDGGPADQLELVNSIVAADSGGAETDGFNGPGGSLSATFSDVCASGPTTPLTGAGNICADPLLADDGNPASFDVRETASSPTIDAGSNELVPVGLTTDAFGTTRVLAGRSVCTGSVPLVVDMGADEFTPAAASCPSPVQKPAPPRPGLTHFVSRKVSPTGVAVKLSCVSTDGQGCSGTIFLTSNETLQGKKVLAVGASHRTRASVRLGQASFALAAGSTATFQVKLNATGRALLRRFHAISAFLLANEASPTSTPFIFLLDGVRFSEPKHKSKKHHPRRLKHSKHH